MAAQLKSLSICLLMAFTVGEEIKFSYNLEVGANQCFMQNMQEDHQGEYHIIFNSFIFNIIGYVSLSSQSTKLVLSVNDPRGRQIENQMGERKMEKSFKVESGGAHQICI